MVLSNHTAFIDLVGAALLDSGPIARKPFTSQIVDHGHTPRVETLAPRKFLSNGMIKPEYQACPLTPAM